MSFLATFCFQDKGYLNSSHMSLGYYLRIAFKVYFTRPSPWFGVFSLIAWFIFCHQLDPCSRGELTGGSL